MASTAGDRHNAWTKIGGQVNDLRHCFVTRMRRLKVDKEVIMAATGHATDIMFRRYRGIDESDLRAIIDAKEPGDGEHRAEQKTEPGSGN